MIKYGDEIVGGIDLIPQTKEHTKIGYFFIRPDRQNKKIGSHVMEMIEKQHKHVSKWSLATPCKEYKNHYFYEKMGYKKTGEHSTEQNDDFKLFEYEKNMNQIFIILR